MNVYLSRVGNRYFLVLDESEIIPWDQIVNFAHSYCNNITIYTLDGNEHRFGAVTAAAIRELFEKNKFPLDREYVRDRVKISENMPPLEVKTPPLLNPGPRIPGPTINNPWVNKSREQT